MVESFSSEPPRLQVLEAVGEGWRAFSRAPWAFVGFTVLIWTINIGCSYLQSKSGINDEGNITNPILIATSFIAFVAGLVASYWGSVGMVRGSWSALNGNSLSFSTFVRWDGAAIWRLFRNNFVLGLIVLILGIVPAILMLFLGGVTVPLLQLPLSMWSPSHIGMVFLAGFAFIALLLPFAYIGLTQKFLREVSLLEGSGPIESIQRGRRVVEPQLGQVILLIFAETAVFAIGFLACCLGLLVAIPLMTCISTAAYRQIFGTEDRTGLLAEEPPAGGSLV